MIIFNSYVKLPEGICNMYADIGHAFDFIPSHFLQTCDRLLPDAVQWGLHPRRRTGRHGPWVLNGYQWFHEVLNTRSGLKFHPVRDDC